MSPPNDLDLRQRLRANVSLAFTSLAWGSFFPIIEYLLQSWDAVTLSVTRLPLAVPVLVAALVLREGRYALFRAVPWRRVWMLGGALAGFTLLMTFGIAHSGAVAAAMLSTTAPILAALMSRVMDGVPLRRGIALAALLAVAGGLLLVFGREGRLDGFRGGEILVLLAVTVWLWHSLAAQKWLKGSSQLRITTLVSLSGGAVLCVAVGLLTVFGVSSPRIDVNGESVALILFLAVVSVAMANLCWHYGVSRLGVTVGAMYNNLIPLVAVAVALAFGSPPTWLQGAGGVLILAGVVYAQRGGREKPAE